VRSISFVTPLVVLVAACTSAAQPAVAARFDGQRALDDVRALVAIGPRPAGSAGARRTRDYIKQQLSKIGVPVEEQAFEAKTPIGVLRMVNLRASVGSPASGAGHGSLGEGGRLVIGGHYDTKLFKELKFVGANDGGSSTAFLLELARVLKQRPPSVPVELLFLDGEEAVRPEWAGEDNTYGSRYYVQAARRNGTLNQIGAFVLVDMIGDRDLRVKREAQSTPWLTDIIWDSAAALGRRQFVEEATPIEDDHIPFLEAGVPAVDIIDLDYPAWHTADDTLDKLSAESLQAVGDVLLRALPEIEKRIKDGGPR
jgi:glutaminyl-peptide cyclotransferase